MIERLAFTLAILILTGVCIQQSQTIQKQRETIKQYSIKLKY